MRHAGAIAAALLLCGCVPIVLSKGYLQSSRQNVPDVVPSFIEVGRTAIADVLLTLGEPDSVAADESWVAYVSRYRESGGGAVLLVGAGPTGGALGGVSEQMLYRRLVVRFDAGGTVMAATAESKRCTDSDFVLGTSVIPAAPCFDEKSRDLVVQDIERGLAAAGESGVVVYDGAEWLPTHQRGLLAVTDTAVHFIAEDGRERAHETGARFAFADLERAEVRRKFFASGDAGRPRVVLLRGGEILGSFTLLADQGDDEYRVQAAARLLAGRLEAARRQGPGPR